MSLRCVLVAGVASAFLACGSSDGGSEPVDTGDAVTMDVAADGTGDVAAEAAGEVAVDTSGEVAVDTAGEVATDVASEATATHPVPEAFATALDNVLAEYLAFTGDPGVSAAVRFADGGFWAGAKGQAVTQAPATDMTTDSQFRVGSNTKPFVAALVMQLVEEGKVGLDAPITTYLPDYPQWSAITVRQLLGMQAGIPDYMWVAEFMIASVFSPDTLTGPDVLLGYVKDKPLEYAPGTSCAYCNTNYVIAGMIIQKATGNPPEVELKNRFFDPLGMTRTYLDVEGKKDPQLAHGYLDLSIVGPVFGIGKDSLAMIPAEWFMSGKLMDSTYTFPPMFSWTAGAIVTTPTDAMVFMRALIRGEIVSKATLTEMQKTHSCSLMGDQVDYGLGLSHGTAGAFGEEWGHGGMNFGYEANTVHAAAADFTVSHMHNYLPEQSWKFEALLLERAKAGAAGAPAPCLLPDGFFAAADGDRVRLRFRGPVNAAGANVDGLTWVRGALGADDVALYGYGTVAHRLDDGTARVEVAAEGPSLAKEIDRRVTTLTIPAALLAGKDGMLADAGFATGVGVLLTERPAADQPDAGKACVLAVPDTTRAARLAICGGTTFQAVAGDTLKLFADLPVTTDAVAVDAWLATAGRAKCL